MFEETSKQGVQGVQDKCQYAPNPHKQWGGTRESGNVLNSLNSMSPCLQKASET